MTQVQGELSVSQPLRFKVAPHIVEDLGLNLYTTLPQVLAEFVANAYDADSPSVNILMDVDAIHEARSNIRQQLGSDKRALESRLLPPTLTISIRDTGVGMTRMDLAEKFLVAGRRRRTEDTKTVTEKRRAIMGRKGLGKLAGFGVAKTVIVTTRAKGESHATRIRLSFDDLVGVRTTDLIEIPDEHLPDGGGIVTSGTHITLEGLLYGTAKSKQSTIEGDLAEHFELIRPEEFAILINDQPIRREPATYVFCWPDPEKAVDDLVDAKVATETGFAEFRYRMRFRDRYLRGARRGVRVYARRRLAMAPSLLDANTNMHGFRMTDYLDGVVEADFLDNEKTDLIATDRQSLRWDAAILSPLRDFLSEKITEACKEYQKLRDNKAPSIVRGDDWTQKQLEVHNLAGRDRALAMKIATHLVQALDDGVDDVSYREKVNVLFGAIGTGNLVSSIAALAAEDKPSLTRVAAKFLELAKEELDGFVGLARARVQGISALKKIVDDQDFGNNKEEKKIQELLEASPWLVDSTYGHTVSANASLSTLFSNLSKVLGIGKAAVNGEDDADRPDLVFLVGNAAVGKIVIVELKAANVVLESKHLDQLLDYMRRTKDWLKVHATGQAFLVHGQLIGSIKSDSHARGAVALRERMEREAARQDWTVRPFADLLNDTQRAHNHILELEAKLDQSSASGGAASL